MKKQELINSIAESRYLGRVFVMPKGFKFSGKENELLWWETRQADEPNDEDYFFFRVMGNINPSLTFEMCSNETFDANKSELSWYDIKDCSFSTLQKIDELINYRNPTKSLLQLQTIRQWCGKDVPLSLEVSLRYKGGVDDDEVKLNSWARIEDYCRRGSFKRNGMRIVAIYDYEASHKIIFNGSKQ